MLQSRLSKLKGAIPPAFKGPLTAAYGSLLSAVTRRAHRDYDPRRTVLLVGTPRSGSTWTMGILTGFPGACPVFEPLRRESDPRIAKMISEFSPRVEPGAVFPALELYLREVLSGHRFTRWSSNHASLRQLVGARWFVVKFVRANRMLGWLRAMFPDNRMVIVLRHPCAVVHSMVRTAGDWSRWSHCDILPPLRRMYGDAVGALVGPGSSREELLAASWAADTNVALAETRPEEVLLLTYEEMCREPSLTLDRIAAYLGEQTSGPTALAAFRKASVMTNPTSAVRQGRDPVTAWVGRIPAGTSDAILAVTRGFGLGFYGPDADPDLHALREAHRCTTRVALAAPSP